MARVLFIRLPFGVATSFSMLVDCDGDNNEVD
jgi:hypothetical protein